MATKLPPADAANGYDPLDDPTDQATLEVFRTVQSWKTTLLAAVGLWFATLKVLAKVDLAPSALATAGMLAIVLVIHSALGHATTDAARWLNRIDRARALRIRLRHDASGVVDPFLGLLLACVIGACGLLGFLNVVGSPRDYLIGAPF